MNLDLTGFDDPRPTCTRAAGARTLAERAEHGVKLLRRQLGVQFYEAEFETALEKGGYEYSHEEPHVEEIRPVDLPSILALPIGMEGKTVQLWKETGEREFTVDQPAGPHDPEPIAKIVKVKYRRWADVELLGMKVGNQGGELRAKLAMGAEYEVIG